MQPSEECILYLQDIFNWKGMKKQLSDFFMNLFLQVMMDKKNHIPNLYAYKKYSRGHSTDTIFVSFHTR